MHYRPTRFKHAVGLDSKFIRDSKGTTYTLLDVFDLATMYNRVLLCDSTKPSDVVNDCKEHWVTWAGIPEKTVVEHWSEVGAAFLTMTSETALFHRVIPVESPWQHGMVGRHGQVFAERINAAVSETHVAGREHMNGV